MRDIESWRPRRYVTLIVVLAVHGALLLALMMTHPPGGVAKSMSPVELIFLPPVRPPPIRLERISPRLDTKQVVSLAPPVSERRGISAPSSRSDGDNSTVDWAAERRRALQAYEIRNNKLADNSSHTSVSKQDDWWPQAHHAGDRYKTESGDWIVWIDSSCYQVASAAATPGADGAPLDTICPDKDP